MENAAPTASGWPTLDWPHWQQTADTLHMLTQIVGKTRLGLTPRQNHWWNVPLYASVRGLTTSLMPLPDGGGVEIEFDFIRHELLLRMQSGASRALPLRSQPVAEFYNDYLTLLAELRVVVEIKPLPVECVDPIRFDLDTRHATYEPAAAHDFWRVLCRVDALLKRFATGFYGKISPVHFFWGSFDLAVTRFNGRRAPPRPGADAIQAEAYSHECISAGFWPGNGGYGRAAFYCYAAPVPPALPDAKLTALGRFDRNLGEFLLDYDEAIATPDPAATVLQFLQETYSACAAAARWDRANLDRNAL